MASFQWLRTTYTEDNFHILACLFAKVRQQQDPNELIEGSAQTATKNDNVQQDDNSFFSDDDDDDDDDDATIAPQTLVREREHGTERLKAAFLDRLAEFMATIPPGGRGTEDDKTAKAKDICATAMQIVDGAAVVYVTKNGGLRPDDVKMLEKLQPNLVPPDPYGPSTLSQSESMEVDFNDHGNLLYENIPANILHNAFLGPCLQTLWGEEELERQLDNNRHLEGFLLQHKRNEDLILARMSHVEKQVLDLFPPGYLNILAIEQGNYGARRSPRIELDPDNPEMYRISSERKVSVVDLIDWQGFSSEDLGPMSSG